MEHHARGPNPADYRIPEELWARGRNVFAFLLLAGGAASAAGYAMDPRQFSFSWLVAFLDCTVLLLGGMFFVMIQFLTGSAWSVTVRRLMENIVSAIPFGLVAFLPVALCIRYLYPWNDTAMMLKDPVLAGKAYFLSPDWFIIRGVVYFALWSLWALMIYRASVSQDYDRHIRFMDRASAWSAPGLLMVMLTATLASFDWIMSLDPHWYSTIFGIYFLVGGALCFFAILTLLCLVFRRNGVLERYINLEHYHDLGKWMFALTVFWAYIGFSQYLLIWYSNLPEETIFFHKRMQGSWLWVSAMLPLGHFLFPFLMLMRRASKRTLPLLGFMAVFIATMCYLDIYWMVMPELHKEGAVFHWLDLSCWCAVFGLYGLVFWYRLKQHAIMPVGDMRFEQGLEFEQI